MDTKLLRIFTPIFGDSTGEDDWVCAKIPNDGRIKKDCVPKKEAPGWYVHLLENRDFKVRPSDKGRLIVPASLFRAAMEASVSVTTVMLAISQLSLP